MSRRAGLLVLALLMLFPPLPAAPPRGEVAVEMLLVSLDLEKKGRVEDIDELERLTSRLARSSGALSGARSKLVQALKEGESDPAAIDAAEEAVAEAEAVTRVGEERRRALVARISERVRRIALLNEEIVKRRSGLRGPADPVTGRWAVIISPGSRRGIYRMALDGTLISGDYSLDGGFRGSLRGTYIGTKVTLQRIDSEQGIDANFYGSLNAAQKRITGTWDATQIAPITGPAAGEWVGNMLADRDEDGDRP